MKKSGKIGVISDVHGNFSALTAVLGLLDGLHCDEIIHTGDVVDIGPRSRECLELLLSRKDVTLLLGNHDRDFALDHSQARNLSHVPTEHKRQVFASMDESLRKAAANFPLCTRRRCGGSTLLFAHYALTGYKQDITQYPFKPLQLSPSAQIFDEMFADVNAAAVFFGHKHEPCDIMGARLYVDVGSVGCHPLPYARAVVIDYDSVGWTYTRVCTPYDAQLNRDQMLNGLACGKQLYDYYFLHTKGGVQ